MEMGVKEQQQATRTKDKTFTVNSWKHRNVYKTGLYVYVVIMLEPAPIRWYPIFLSVIFIL